MLPVHDRPASRLQVAAAVLACCRGGACHGVTYSSMWHGADGTGRGCACLEWLGAAHPPPKHPAVGLGAPSALTMPLSSVQLRLACSSLPPSTSRSLLAWGGGAGGSSRQLHGRDTTHGLAGMGGRPAAANQWVPGSFLYPAVPPSPPPGSPACAAWGSPGKSGFSRMARCSGPADIQVRNGNAKVSTPP